MPGGAPVSPEGGKNPLPPSHWLEAPSVLGSDWPEAFSEGHAGHWARGPLTGTFFKILNYNVFFS
jgi:hypothetical protein